MSFPFAVQAWELLSGAALPSLILDLREPASFARGHLRGAHCLPYNRFQAESPTISQGHPSILVVDPGGARAAEMAVYLRRFGFAAGYLEGGLAAWPGELVTGEEKKT